MGLCRHVVIAAVLGLSAATAQSATAAIPALPTAELISQQHGGAVPAGASEVAIAGGGRYAAFTSSSTALLPGQPSFDTNGTCDVFRRDLVEGTTVLVSRVPSGGLPGSSCSRRPRISSEGQVVAFSTDAPNLITAAGGSGAPAGVQQVLVADLAAGTLVLASRADSANGSPAPGPAVGGADFALSGDGRHVAFVSGGALQPAVPTPGDKLWLRDLAAATTTLASAQDGSTTSPVTDTPHAPSLDQYGLRVAWATTAAQVLLREPGQNTEVVSQSTVGALIDGGHPALSATGRHVAFTTRSLTASFTQQVVVRDLDAATTTLVSHPAAEPGTMANADAGPPSISAQGRVVAFASAATNLGAGASGGRTQVYVADLRREFLTLASPAAGGGGAGGGGESSSGGEGSLLAPSLDQGGIAVAYTSAASDLVPADGDTSIDAVVRRVRNAQTVPVDRTRELTTNGLDGRNIGQQRLAAGNLLGEGVIDVALSASGRYAAFTAGADRFAGDPRPALDTVTYVRDRLTGEVESVSRQSDSGGRPGALFSGYCSANSALSISATGRFVTFCAAAGIYRRDLELGLTERVDVPSGGGAPNGVATLAGISASGRYVAFGSTASNLIAGTIYTGVSRLFLRDLQLGTTVRVDLRDGTTDDTGYSSPGPRYSKPSISDDGRFVAFEFQAATLVSGSGIDAGYPQAYVRDLQTGRTHLLNRSESGAYGRYGPSATGQTQSAAPKITPDGRYVTFTSNAANLIVGKTSTHQAVYRQRLTYGGAGGSIDGPLDLVSVPHAGGGTQLDGAAELSSISDDGTRVAFVGTATNLISGAIGHHIYARDLPSGNTVLLSRADGPNGTPSPGQPIHPPGISADGAVVSFDTRGTTLEGDSSPQTKLMARTLAPTAGTSPPSNLSLPAVSPTSPMTGEVASCAPGNWTGTPSFTYVWLLDGSPVAGESGASFVPPVSAHLKELRCRVTASNAAGGNTATSGPRTVQRPAPVVAVQGDTIFAQTVTCNPGRWAGEPSLSFTWLSGPVSSAPGAPIAGASGATLELEAPVVERWLRCRATITEGGGPVAITSNARYVHPEVTIVRAPQPLTQPREGEAFTCSDTELRVRPGGYGVQHGYFTRYLRSNGEISLDTPKAAAPATQGPIGGGAAGVNLSCIDEGTVGAATSYRAEGPLATVASYQPTPPTPPPAELPQPTNSPQIAFATEMERFCRPPAYGAPTAGIASRFRWTYHYAAGNQSPVPESELKAGLLGAGQVFTGVASFGGFGSGQPTGLSCSHVLSDGQRERVTRSAIVRPQISCTKIGKQGGEPGPGGIPFAVSSIWCAEFSDSGTATTVAAAPPLPTPSLNVAVSGAGATATMAIGCGSATTSTAGCTFTATLYAVRSAASKASGQRLQAAPVITTTTKRGKRLAQVRRKVKKGQRAATVKLKLTGTTAKQLKARKSVQTLLVVRYGKGKATTIAAPVLTRKRR